MNLRKFILPTIAAATLAGACLVGIHAYSTEDNADDLLLQNIEALTKNNEEGVSEYWYCWSSLTEDGGGAWRCGNPCDWVEHRDGKDGMGKCYSK